MNNLRDERETTIIKEYISWKDVENFIQFLADNTHNFKDFNGVYAPPRGGVVFGSIISNRYNLPYLAAPQVGCLVIDDIVDSGDTAMTWRQKGYKIACMYYNQNSKIKPDLYWKFKEDKWCVFPWEEYIPWK